MIWFLPLSWRKLIIDVCRIRVQPSQNDRLSSILGGLELCVYAVDVHPVQILYKHDLDNLLGRLIYSPLLLSMLSYFARAEQTFYKDDFLEQRNVSLEKEFQAALVSHNPQQTLNYSPLIAVVPGRLHSQLTGSMNPRVLELWHKGIRNLMSKTTSDNFLPLLPAYNAKKNVGYQTQRNYFSAQGLDPSEVIDAQYKVTTLDLLKHYYPTGEQIPGPMEVRQAWSTTTSNRGHTTAWAVPTISRVCTFVVQILPSTDPERT